LACVAIFGAPAQAQFETRGSFVFQGDPYSIAVGDFNHDGKLDLAVADWYYGKVAVSLGNGDGTFQPPVYYPISNQLESVPSIATADLRKSGNLDLVVADYQDGNVSVLLGKGDGTFEAAQPYSTAPNYPSFVTIGNFGGPYPDLLILDGQNVSVMIGNGDGTFQTPINTLTAYSARAVGIGDFNHDGKMDVAAAEVFGGIDQVEILLGNGDGTFSLDNTYLLDSGADSIAVASFRNNGKLDMAIAQPDGSGISILLGNGDGTFRAGVVVPASFAGGIQTADFNGDGKPDLVVVEGILSSSQPVDVFLGNGDGTFQPGMIYPLGKQPSFIAVGDFNGDHKMDMAVADSLESVVVTLLNTAVVRFSPTTPLTFLPQMVGTNSAPQTVTLTNTGLTALSIRSITTKGPYQVSNTCGSSVAPGANCSLTVTFEPKTQGTKSGTISISDSASSKPQVIELTGGGTVVQLSPPSLTFPAQKVHTTSSPQLVQLTNEGTKALNITKVKINGFNFPDFSETNTCPSSLSANASCTISVTFTPTGTGTRTALVYITDTGGGSPQTVRLTGTGR
jgi:hypothetical protein